MPVALAQYPSQLALPLETGTDACPTLSPDLSTLPPTEVDELKWLEPITFDFQLALVTKHHPGRNDDRSLAVTLFVDEHL